MFAGVAQLVECQLPKLNVAGSNPVARLKIIFTDTMRLPKELIEKISKKIVSNLLKREMIIWDETPEKLETVVEHIITEDLMVEDHLNDEVKTLLETRTDEYERDMMDYGRAFQLVKSRLARERGLVL